MSTPVLSMNASPESATPRVTPVVLVTGAGKRLGREIALALARAGWRVAVHYRGSAQEAQHTVADCAAHTAGSAAFQADLADEAATRALLPAVAAHMGQVDAIINCAALFEHDTTATFSYAALDAHLHANTAAPIVLAQALHQHVVQREAKTKVKTEAKAEVRSTAKAEVRGVVVNLLDQKLWNPNPDFLSYTLSKAALEAANTLLAMALAPQVRVVGVAPGLTLTSHMLTDAQFEARHKLSPLGHSSTVPDVCASVLFALTNQSITGTTLLVDGGQHLMKFERDFSLM